MKHMQTTIIKIKIIIIIIVIVGWFYMTQGSGSTYCARQKYAKMSWAKKKSHGFFFGKELMSMS